MDTIDRRMILGAAGLAGVAAMTKLAGAGPLTPPPGPVGPTGQTLDDIYHRIARTDVGVAEPRIPVQSLPGGGTALHVISEPGCYCLTQDVQGVAGKDGIEVIADDVWLDLGGFALLGAPGALSGVTIAPGVRRVHIVSGRIVGWPLGDGVAAPQAEQISVESVTAQSNVAGINLGARSLVRNCRGVGNGFSAFIVRAGSLIENCESAANGSFDVNYHGGAFCFNGGSSVRGLRSIADAVGVRVEDTGVVSGCRVMGATSWGMRVGSRVNVCDNDFISVQNGIEAFAQSVIEGNRLSGCNGLGLVIRSSQGFNRVDNNRLVETNVGVVIESPSIRNLVTRNSVQTYSGAAYALSAGTSHGPIVDLTGAGDISSIPGANHPWANFIY